MNERRTRGPQQEGELHSPERIEEALNTMYLEATRLGIRKGVGLVLVQLVWEDKPTVHFTIVERMERDPNPEREGDTGTNYLAVAMAKLSEMLSTHTNSGSKIRPVKFGEVGYRGGLFRRVGNTIVCTAFSGGTEDQDVQIAQKGLENLLQ